MNELGTRVIPAGDRLEKLPGSGGDASVTGKGAEMTDRVMS